MKTLIFPYSLTVIILLLWGWAPAPAAPPGLVRDINPGVAASSSSPSGFREIGGVTVFSGTDPIHGTELWKTDGTAAGTEPVKDIRPGSQGSNPALIGVMGGAVYFVAEESLSGRELWRTDGTAAGTVMVKDIKPGMAGSNPYSPVIAGGWLYFFADYGVTGNGLWKSDGTAVGTVLVGNIWTGISGAPLHQPANLTLVGSTLFFSGDGGLSGNELWKSDGTVEGTVQVKDIHPGTNGFGFPLMYNNSNPGNFCAVANTLFFTASDGLNGNEVWKSNGTAEGTILVKDIYPGILDGVSSGVPVAVLGGNYFFQASNGTNGSRLWKSDGTAAGTGEVVPTGAEYPASFCVMGGTLFFSAFHGDSGTELWKTDGTVAGSVMVRDLRPGTPGSNPFQLTEAGGLIYFTAENGTDGTELWKSDGTAGGTLQVKDIREGSLGSQAASLSAGGSGIYFRADDGVSGSELWKSDGTPAGTLLVRDINQTTAHSAPASLTTVGSKVYFSATDGTTGMELWISDGTTAGTRLTKDIRAGTLGSLSTTFYPAAVGNQVFFVANDGSTGLEVWKSDGTTLGTVQVKDIRAGSLSPNPQYLTGVGNTLFFTANDNVMGMELWKSDGTTAGTSVVKDIVGGSGGSAPDFLTPANGTLFFVASDAANGRELWKSDGTPTGTVLVKDIRPGITGSNPAALTAVGSLVYFTANDGTNGTELWKSDGSAAGTVMVQDLSAGSSGTTLFSLTGGGNILYFNVSSGPAQGLWKTDGSAAGTMLIKGNPASWFVTSLTAAGNSLYFTYTNGTQSYELWKTDGTVAGTALLKDIRRGSGNPSITNLKTVGGTLYFSADNGADGAELWSSDGTGSGTAMVADLLAGPGGSDPAHLVAVGDRLFFSALSGVAGRELWTYAPSSPELSGVTAGSAATLSHLLISGLVNPGGVGTAVVVEYGTSPALGSTWYIGNFSGNTSQAFSATLYPGGLVSGTTYYYQVRASSVMGTITAGPYPFSATAGSPEIAVETSSGTTLPSTFPTVNLGAVDRRAPPRAINLTVRNTGDAPLTGLGASLSQAGFLYTITAPLPPGIAPGGSAVLSISYDAPLDCFNGMPIMPITHGAQLTVTSNDADESNYAIFLSAEAVQPRIQLRLNGQFISPSGPAWHFPRTRIGTPATAVITVQNMGTAPLITTAPVALAGDNAFTVAGPDDFTLAPSAEVNYTLTFTPGAAGPALGSLSFSTDDPCTFGTSIVNFDGTGNAIPDAPDISVMTVEDMAFPGISFSLNITDADSDPLLLEVLTLPARGTLQGLPAPTAVLQIGVLSYTPAPNFHGTEFFTYRVFDGYVHSRTATATLTVSPVNDPPSANPQTLATVEDTPLPITLSATDIDSTAFTFAITENPLHGTLSGTGAAVIYTPHPDYHGQDAFSFTVSDGTAPVSSPATVSITITPDNGTPDISLETPAGLVLNDNGIYSLGNVERSAPPVATAFIVRNTGAETLADLTAALTPASPFATGIWTVAVPLPATIPPGGTAELVISYDALEDSSPTGAALPDGSILHITSNDADESPYRLSLSALPVKPEIVVEINGVVGSTNPPAPFDFGRFILPRSQTISVRILNQGSSVLQTTSPVDFGSSPGFTAAGPDTFSLAPGEAAAYVLTFDPPAPGLYFTSFRVVTNDSDESQVMLAFQGRGNAPPVATDTVRELEEDSPWVVSFPSVLAADTDGDYWSFHLMSAPANGSIIESGVTRTYVPENNWSGTDTFTFRVFDGLEYSAVKSAVMHVAALNDPPQAIAQSISLPENGALGMVLEAQDVDNTAFTFAITQPPAHGTLTGTGPVRTYTPAPGYHGPDQFTFETSDGAVSSTAVVSITVIQNLPEIQLEHPGGTVLTHGAVLDLKDVERLAPALATTITVTNTGTAPLSGLSALLNQPGSGYQITGALPASIAPGESASLVVAFDPLPLPHPGGGRTPLTAAVEIASNDVDEASLTLHFTAVPVQPDLRLFLDGLPVEVPVTQDFGRRANHTTGSAVLTLRNEGSSTLVSAAPSGPVPAAGFSFTGPAGFSLAPSSEAAWQISFSPAAAASYQSTVTFGTNGFEGDLTIQLRGRGNTPPVAAAAAASCEEDTPWPGTAFPLSGMDADGDALTWSIVSPPAHVFLEGLSAAGAAGEVFPAFLPDPDFHGTDTFTYRVFDGVEYSPPATVTLTVTPVNDPPTALAQSLTTPENTPLPITLTAVDVDDAVLNYAIVTPPAHGTLTGTGADFTYVPQANYFGPDHFVFRVADGAGAPHPAAENTVTIDVISDGIDPAELDPEYPPGTPVANGGTIHLGTLAVGGSRQFSLLLRNTGTGPLTGMPPQISGPQEADFTLTGTPAFPLAAGASTPLMVTWTPGGTGLRKADLLVLTNDSDESPYQMTLEGLATGPGLLDSSFTTVFPFSGGISAMAEQPDGKLVLGGYFAALAGSMGPNLVRLVADGAVDPAFTGTADDSVSTVSVLGDGKLLVGGFFSQVNGVPRPYLARLEPDGALDESFAPVFNNYINCVAVQHDGRVLVGGAFTEVNGLARSRLVRLLEDGSVDPDFLPEPDGEVHSLLILGDGRFYAGGSFGGIGGASRNLLARLNQDGTADASFTPDLTGGWISGFVVQADHGVVIGGQLGSVDGLGRGFFSRLLANGRLDPGFSGITPANRQVNCLVGQADGKTLLGGPFFEVGSQWRHGSARLNPNGTLDTTFNPDTWLGAESSLVLKNGRVLLAGNFTTVGGLPANRIARLVNDPASESLTVIAADNVRWLRGGSAPETTQASFDVSLDGQNTWTASGHGVRIAGGWRMTGGVLPVGGHVRGRARIHGGLYGGSSGLVESVTSFGVTPAPEITIEAPAGTPLADGGMLAFGTAPSAGEVVRTVRILNTGPAPLSGLQLIMDGPQAAEFSVTSLSSATLTGGGADLLTVRFSPLTAGLKTAVLHILSNDEDEPSFDLTLTGQALVPVITAISQNEEIFEGDGVMLAVEAMGSGPFSYQWYAGISGVTTRPVGTDAPDFATGPLTDHAGYWVRVLNSYGQTDSVPISVIVRPRIPVFTSSLFLTGRAGELFSATVQATHGPLSFSSSDLPDWLVLDSSTGELSGLPGAAGAWTFHITALTGAVISRSATVRHELTVTPPRPVITSADAAQARRNIPFAYQITAIPVPDGYAAAPLPAGLVINGQTGVISGIPGVAGVFNITLSAANAGGTGQQLLQLVIEPPLPPPSMVTPAFASASANLPFSFELSATPQPLAFEIDGPPAWLALDAGSGLLYGTPPAPRSAVFRIRAVNESGPGAWLTMTVAIAPHPDTPAITSVTEKRTRVGDLFEFQIEAAPQADHFTINGTLPAGITYDSTSGLLTGTSGTVGTVTVGVFGSNAFGPGQTRPLTVVTGPKRQVPVISSSASLAAALGIAFSTTVQASFSPTAFEFTGLPAGLAQSGTSGQLAGMFATPGIYPFSARASNADGFGPSQLFNLTVGYAAGAPAISVAGGGVTGYVGIPFSYAVPVSPNASSFTASGLPDGLTAGNNGFIAGRPLRQGVFPVILQGRNSAGLGEPREWVINILPTPDTPEITGSLREETEALMPYVYQIQTRSQLPVTRYAVTGLPPGITYNQSTGIISGGAVVASAFQVGLRASNQAGIGAEKILTLHVRPGILVPRVTSAPSLIGRQGASLSYQITATHPPVLAYQATGLPAGLNLNATTGRITGQVHTPGLYPVTLRASNVNGASDPMVLQVHINPLPAVPVMQIPSWILIYSGQPLNLQLRATNMPETTPWPAGVGIFSDNLPLGMSLSPAGILSGFPNQGDEFTKWDISFYAVNETGRGPAFWSVIRARKLTAARPVINGPKQLAMEQGKILSFRISATGSPRHYEFGVARGGYGHDYNGTSANVSVSLGNIPGSYLYYLGAYSAEWGLLSGLPLQVSPTAGAPVIQTPSTNFATAGAPLNFQLSASNSPYADGYEVAHFSPSWPSGLYYSSTGRFTGTVTQAGVFSFQARARNAAGYSLPKEISLYFQAPVGAPVLGGGALQSGTSLRVAALGAAAAAETLPAVLEARVGEEFSYQFYASGSLLRYVVEGLPEGIVFNENTGGMAGQPLRPGTSVLKVTAVGAETTSDPATIRLVTAAAAGTPSITSVAELNVVAGSLFSWTFAADSGATGFNLESPPDWLGFDAFTGVLTGTPPAPGQEKIVLSAFNPMGEGPAQTFSLNISAAPGTLTVNAPAAAFAGRVGEPFTASLTVPGTPDFFDATALPFGISLDAATGTFSGIPVESGTFEATVWAVNSAGLGTPVPVSFSIPAAAGTPVITSAGVLNVPAGIPFTHAFTASPAPTSFTVEGLSSGWNFNPLTGVLSAVPQEGTYQLSVEAWNPAGSSGQQPFQLSVGPAANSAELWRQDQFGAEAGNPAVAGWESDPDRDGINNLVEMAFNLRPRDSTIPEMSIDELTGLPRLLPAVAGQDRLRLQFLRRKASTNPGITYRPQFCADLTNTGAGGWQDANGTPAVSSLNATWELVTIEDTNPARRRFARVVISQP